VNESRLLGIVLPSFPVLRAILDRIREKYDIPPVLPENAQLIETLRAERSQEEWAAVLADLERELDAEVFAFPPQLAQLIQRGTEFAEAPGTTGEPVGETSSAADSGSARLAVTVITQIIKPLIEWRDRARRGLAVMLLDHLITGRRIEFPEQLVYPIGRVDIPPGDDPESLVVAVAHRFSNPDEMARRFRAKIIETFGSKHTIQEEHLELAEYLARRTPARTSRTILSCTWSGILRLCLIGAGRSVTKRSFRR